MLSSQIKEPLKNNEEETIIDGKLKHLEHIKNPGHGEDAGSIPVTRSKKEY